jgi:hypothetical protein
MFGQASDANPKASKFAFKDGEWLKYRMSYSNFLNAGYSTMSVSDAFNEGKEAFHIQGHGKSTGLVSVFFKVRDEYQTYMYKETLKPYKFIRNIDEGGYTKNKEILFNHNEKKAVVKNLKHNTIEDYPIPDEIQDLLSSMYYLRNQDLSKLKDGEEISIKMFFDQEINDFKLRMIGREIIKTKFGKFKTLMFRPLVQSGRVFKEQESVTVWISDDKNKVPLKIKASLAIGSLRADLDEFKGLAHPFNIIFDN